MATVPDNTRSRLIEAAGLLFAERGLKLTTVRAICKKAGTNIAAVNYHFGDKTKLYTEVLASVFDYLMTKYPPYQGQDTARTPRQKLEAFVRAFLGRMLDPDQPAWHRRLIAREMAEPSPMMREVVENCIRRGHDVLLGIVGEVLGGDAPPETLDLCVASIVGQCLFYHRRHMIGRLHRHVAITPEGVESLVRHITEFSLGGLRARKPRKPTR
jgi:TetR/AcrR family transcriptional regulator, regulator of cefoperazone and chloramphenicol sensitivity